MHQVLKEQIGIIEGIDAELKKGNESKTIKEWIAYGGEAEDYGLPPFKWDKTSTRAFNHYHDPLEEWDEARFKNDLNALYIANYLRYPVSAILWGLRPGEQDFFWNYTGDWS